MMKVELLRHDGEFFAALRVNDTIRTVSSLDGRLVIQTMSGFDPEVLDEARELLARSERLAEKLTLRFLDANVLVLRDGTTLSFLRATDEACLYLISIEAPHTADAVLYVAASGFDLYFHIAKHKLEARVKSEVKNVEPLFPRLDNNSVVALRILASDIEVIRDAVESVFGELSSILIPPELAIVMDVEPGVHGRVYDPAAALYTVFYHDSGLPLVHPGIAFHTDLTGTLHMLLNSLPDHELRDLAWHPLVSRKNPRIPHLRRALRHLLYGKRAPSRAELELLEDALAASEGS